MKRNFLLRFLPVLAAIILAITVIAGASSTFADTNPDKPNDTTQGRLRINQCLTSAPDVNVYVNGKPAVDGGVSQTLGATETSGYLYLAPGTYSLALVRDGGSIDHPFFGPVSVQVTAGHRFTVVVLGQSNDPTHQALVIDETAAYAAIGATHPDNKHIGHITVNNLKGASSLYFVLGGVQQEKGVAYGKYEATQWPAYAKGIGLEAGGQMLFEDNGTVINPAGEDNLDCVLGTFPDGDTHTTSATTLLNTVDYLKQFSEFSATTGGETPTFNTYLAALKSTGLEDTVVNGSPLMIFAPTDEAFASLPKEQRDALMSSPKMLADTLRANMSEGYYPVASLGSNGFDRTVKDMLGNDLVLSGQDVLKVNGVEIAGGDDYIMAANGTRLFWTSKLLVPLSSATTPTTASTTPQPLPTVQIPGTNSRTFSETGKTVSGLFLDYWDKNGGLTQQGFPISGPMGEVSPLDGRTYTVQYFERAVFEYHPENAAPYNVLLSQLGTFQYKSKYPKGAPGQKPNTSAGSMLFSEKGHRVGGKFLDYWQKSGGLAQQGYPISDEFQEKSDLDGKTYTVQYFERAVFESHPENQPPYDVLLSQLGTFRYKDIYQKP